MKYTEIKYTRRHNTGNYEFEEASLGAVIDEGEDAQEVGAKVKNQVEVFLGLAKPAKKEPEPAKTPAKPEPKEEPKKEEVKEEAPEKKEPKKKAPAKKKAAPKKKAPEPAVTYDRDVKAHKDELVNIFDELRPGWNKDNDLAKICKGISEEMVGEYIFDSEGKILETFNKKVEELLIDQEEEAGGL